MVKLSKKLSIKLLPDFIKTMQESILTSMLKKMEDLENELFMEGISFHLPEQLVVMALLIH